MKTQIKIILIIFIALSGCTKIEYTDNTQAVDSLKTILANAKKTTKVKSGRDSITITNTITLRDTVFLVKETIIRDTIYIQDTVFVIKESVRWDTVFVNAPAITVTDIDGNLYKTVKIGSQVWMAENLKTTRFNNGSNIPQGWPADVNNGDFNNALLPGYNWLDFDIANKDQYGAFYNGRTVENERLCPTGWHMPSIDEFDALVSFLSTNGGGKSLASKTGWVVPQPINTGRGSIPVPLTAVGLNPDLNNSSGFNGQPIGTLDPVGVFYNLGSMGIWWLIPRPNNTFPCFDLTTGSAAMEMAYTAADIGMPVRCLKD